MRHDPMKLLEGCLVVGSAMHAKVLPCCTFETALWLKLTLTQAAYIYIRGEFAHEARRLDEVRIATPKAL